MEREIFYILLSSNETSQHFILNCLIKCQRKDQGKHLQNLKFFKQQVIHLPWATVIPAHTAPSLAELENNPGAGQAMGTPGQNLYRLQYSLHIPVSGRHAAHVEYVQFYQSREKIFLNIKYLTYKKCSINTLDINE